MAVTNKAIFELSDAEIKSIVRGNASVTALSQSDLLAELDRRAAANQIVASFVLSATGVGIAIIALALSILRA